MWKLRLYIRKGRQAQDMSPDFGFGSFQDLWRYYTEEHELYFSSGYDVIGQVIDPNGNVKGL